jgi:hypothetical protein
VRAALRTRGQPMTGIVISAVILLGGVLLVLVIAMRS